MRGTWQFSAGRSKSCNLEDRINSFNKADFTRAREEYGSISSSSLLDSSGIMSLNVATLRASVSDVSSGRVSFLNRAGTFRETYNVEKLVKMPWTSVPRLITIICELSPRSFCTLI